MKKLIMCLVLVFGFVSVANALTFRWDRHTDPTVKGFTVRYGEVQGSNYIYNRTVMQEDVEQVIENGVDSSQITFDDNLFMYGNTYYFVCEAFNDGGKSGYSNEAVYDKPAYTPPADNLPDPVIVIVPSGVTMMVIGG